MYILEIFLDESITKSACVEIVHVNKLIHNIQVHLNKLECRGKVHLFQ